MTGVLDRSEARTEPTAPPDAHAPADAQAVSPSARQVGRRSIPWIVLGVIAVLVALLGILLSGGKSAGVPLDPANAGLAGGKAVAEVLRQQGVDVRSATGLGEVQDHATDDTTVLVYDPEGNLDDAGFDRLTSIASTIVVVEPGYRALQRLAPGVRAAGGLSGAGTVSAACDVPPAVRAERIDPRPTPNLRDVTVAGTFRIGSAASGDATGCFAAGDRYSLVTTKTDGREVALLGSAAVLMNDGVDRAGNAALALNLLGGHRTLVWYLPGLADRAVTGPPDLAALTPGWVTPVVLLLVFVFIAAAFWRGRRFGPLVIENLPVVVRAGETREGRARLYQRSSARLRALDSLRIGSLGRLAGLTGLPQAATAGEISDAVAAVTRRDRHDVRTLLIDGVPRTDADLIAQSDHLAELERATAAAVTPGHPGPTGRMDA
ncbi:DUF4350 domain-containing protein [Leifsonia sp. NPDC058248]|uniref:DUF4350 domain-containing protein n=1 Tax=Leifsonia sp. NPDC058248 TaxID=3346402 RepID=UPI0036DABD52